MHEGTDDVVLCHGGSAQRKQTKDLKSQGLGTSVRSHEHMLEHHCQLSTFFSSCHVSANVDTFNLCSFNQRVRFVESYHGGQHRVVQVALSCHRADRCLVHCTD